MRQYETAFLIAPNLPEEDNDKIIDQMAGIVSEKEGKIVNIDKWGKRRLAYPIHKFREAFYVFLVYEGGPSVPAELERRFKQTEAVLRYLTVRNEAKKIAKEKKRKKPKSRKREMTTGESESSEKQQKKAKNVAAGQESGEEE